MTGDKKIILDYLKYLNDWEFEYKIRAIKTPFGWIGARGDRNVRDLIKAGKLEKRMEGKYCQVRYPEEKLKEIPVFPKGKLFESPNRSGISI